MKHYLRYDTAGAITASYSTDGPPEMFGGQAVEVSADALNRVRSDQDNCRFMNGVLWIGSESVDHVAVLQTVPMASLRKALRRMLVNDARPELGYALPALEAYVEQDGDLYDELHYSPDVARGHATVEKLGRLFGWSDAKLDELFRLAGTL